MLKRLRRKWWFWAGLAGLLTFSSGWVAAVVEWYVTRARGEARLAEAVARLDAEDPGWRTADLAARRNAGLPPASENGAVRAVEAAGLIPQEVDDWARQEKWRADLTPGVLPDDDDVCELAAVHDGAGEAVAVARSVRGLPRGGLPLVFREPNPYGTLLEHTQRMRAVASLLDVDALVLAHRGRPDEAVEAAHAILNLAPAVGDEPTLISQLVRMAMAAVAKTAAERTLGLGEPAAGLAELQAAFAGELAADRLGPGFRGERAAFHMVLDGLDAGTVSIDEAAGGPGPAGGGSAAGRAGMVVLRKYVPGQQAEGLDLFGRMLAANRLTGPARRAAFAAIPDPPQGYEHLLLRLLQPAIQKVVASEDRTRALLGTAVAALACERYRRQFGEWPASLDAIPKEILPAVPADPYTDGPLKYRLTADGAVVYATGPDLADDDGRVLNAKVGPGTDVGFRLLDPAHRRQPPPPKPVEPADGEPSPDEVVPDPELP